MDPILIGMIILLAILSLVQIALLLRKPDDGLAEIKAKLASLEQAGERFERLLRDEMARSREEAGQAARQLREEIAMRLKDDNDSLVRNMAEMAQMHKGQLAGFAERVDRLVTGNEQRLDTQKTVVDGRLQQIQAELVQSGKGLRDEVNATLKAVNDSLLQKLSVMSAAQQQQLEGFAVQLGKLTDTNQQKLDQLRQAVELKLTALQEDNSKQLEKMRLTVDEKLQSTLEQRLGESFRQVGERLEQVHRGLGEMQTLATGVGDLKKVLTNVKARGTWGEVQLGSLLEQVLAPEQYATNVATKDGGERVEFAVRLPGRADERDDIVWLPIDAKYPLEDYQRLLEAQEKGDALLAEAAMKQLESRIRQDAATIRDKYLNPPRTTDFAILFVPTEGLFAEILRRPGLTDLLQRDCRVMVAGPTTLWSLLNSLQMGFRTLAIEKRSSEVWNLLGAVKTEWAKYGDVLAKVQKKLQEASNTIDSAQQRTRAVGRKLKTVQELPQGETEQILMLDALDSGVETDQPSPAG